MASMVASLQPDMVVKLNSNTASKQVHWNSEPYSSPMPRVDVDPVDGTMRLQLFERTLPVLRPPEGQLLPVSMLYQCKDCGDTYTLQSSYLHHVHRRTLSVKYECEICRHSFVFYNQCAVSAHYRAHADTGNQNRESTLNSITISSISKDLFEKGLFNATMPSSNVVSKALNNNKFAKKKFVAVSKMNGQVAHVVNDGVMTPESVGVKEMPPLTSLTTTNVTDTVVRTNSETVHTTKSAVSGNVTSSNMTVVSTSSQNVGLLGTNNIVSPFINNPGMNNGFVIINQNQNMNQFMANHKLLLCEGNLVALPNQPNLVPNIYNPSVPQAPQQTRIVVDGQSFIFTNENPSTFTDTAPLLSVPVPCINDTNTVTSVPTKDSNRNIKDNTNETTLSLDDNTQHPKRQGLILKDIGSLLAAGLPEGISKIDPVVEDSRKKCTECGQGVSGTMEEHFTGSLKGDIPPTFCCPICCLLLPNFCALKAHKRVHKKIPPFVCPECGVEFRSAKLLKDHFDYKCFHQDKCIRHKCPSNVKCNSTLFSVASVFTQHLLTAHTKMIFKCLMCPIACFTPGALNTHMKKIHEGVSERPSPYYQCQICPERLIPKARLYIHMEEHCKAGSRVYAYCCVRCNKVNTNKEQHALHVKTCAELLTVLTSTVQAGRKKDKSVKAQQPSPDISSVTEKVDTNANTEGSPAFSYLGLKRILPPVAPSDDASSAKTTQIEEKVRSVVKQCQGCKIRVVFQCTADNIVNLPDRCPKCIQKNSKTAPVPIVLQRSYMGMKQDPVDDSKPLTKPIVPKTGSTYKPVNRVVCHICKESIVIDWEKIKEHYSSNHKEFNLNTLKPIISRLSLEKEQQIKDMKMNRDEKRRLSQTNHSTAKGITKLNRSASDSVMQIDCDTNDSSTTTYSDTTNSKSKRQISKADNMHDYALQEASPKKKKKRSINLKGKQFKSDEDIIISPFSAGLNLSPPSGKEDSNLNCSKCDFVTENKTDFYNHVQGHRDVKTAYQCMECGSCFMVKSTLEKHLLITHGIEDVDMYLKEHNCVDKEAIKALLTSVIVGDNTEIQLKENQCRICKEEFDSKDNHDKHFRIHGMAFLKQKQLDQTIATV